MDPEMNSGKLIPEGENQFRDFVSETSLKENSGIFTEVNPEADPIPENDTIPENDFGFTGIRNGVHLSPTFLKRGLNNNLFEQKPGKESYGTIA